MSTSWLNDPGTGTAVVCVAWVLLVCVVEYLPFWLLVLYCIISSSFEVFGHLFC